MKRRVAKENDVADAEIAALVSGDHKDPHRILGPHGGVVRVWRPQALAVEVVAADGSRHPMKPLDAAGLFEVDGVEGDNYRLDVTYDSGTYPVDDPYRFWPTLGDLDLHLFGEGRHEHLWRAFGAHPRVHQEVQGTAFAVWAPGARSVRVVGDFNGWDGRSHPMRMLGSSGVWELFIPALGPGTCYKFEILTGAGEITLKADPFAFEAERLPGTASVVNESSYQWADGEWMAHRHAVDDLTRPISIYECHMGSWRRVPEEGDRPLTYREMADQLPAYLNDLGFTHVEFMPVAEHPFDGSWGYQVTAYYAPTARHGSPDDFRALVDALHAAGIGVIVDWVPAHFPKDAFALARFDGTALYEHADPRQGEHPDWGTLVFNFGRHEVRNFLVANALYWIEEFHLDGLRVDAVASMIYLDYSREADEWVPNQFGGRENLEALDFLRRVNEVVYATHPGVMTMAEESTAWPAVSRPTYLGGLGFGFKWNMGWMHDTLEYFSNDPIHRQYHHHHLTFGLLYAFSENFVLPLSHDEVVHGKASLFDKMPGSHVEKAANLRTLLAWMWAHPGKNLLFMGGELAQGREWAHDRSLDWDLLQYPEHRGVQDLVRALNTVSTATPALYQRDFEADGFSWIDANDSANNVISFSRFAADGTPFVCVANLSGMYRPQYRIGLPAGGRWRRLLDTQDPAFGGWGAAGPVEWESDPVAWHSLDQSLAIDLSALSVVWLAPVAD